MRGATAGLWLLASGTVSAAPFLVSDPYPASGPQPTEFVITLAGQPAPVVVPATSGPDGVYLHWDVATLRGNVTLTAKARNAWGESASSAPFSFGAGLPGLPTGLRLLP